LVVVPLELELEVDGWGVAEPVVSAWPHGCFAVATGFCSTRKALRSCACWKEKQYTLGVVTRLMSWP